MTALDHVIVVVSSLEEAGRTFRSAGFTVTPGGRHDAVPTANALVCFRDGSYLELMAARDPGDRAEWRSLAADSAAWARHLHGVSAIARRFLPALARADGVADWCLLDSRLGATASRLRALELPAAGPTPMSRERPDGERLEWEMLLPESRLLPFWIRDRTPRERRVPDVPEAVRHANGARGIVAVRLRAASVGLSALTLGDLLGAAPRARPDGITVLEPGGTRIELLPGEPEGAYAVTLAGCVTPPDDVRSLGVLPEGGG